MSAISQVFNGQSALAAALGTTALPPGVTLSNQAIGTVKYIPQTGSTDFTDVFDATLLRGDLGRAPGMTVPIPGPGWWQLKAIQFTANRVGGLDNIDSAIRFKVFGWRRQQFEQYMPSTNPADPPRDLPQPIDNSWGEFDDDSGDTANDRWLGPDEDPWAFWELIGTPTLSVPGVLPGPHSRIQAYFTFPPDLMAWKPEPQPFGTPQFLLRGMGCYFRLHAVMPRHVTQVRLIFFFDTPR